MIANENQKEICDKILQQVEFWKSSNDINSPSHYCENNTVVETIECLSDEDKEDLINFLDNLFDFIKEH
jgi:hypothetical protein